MHVCVCICVCLEAPWLPAVLSTCPGRAIASQDGENKKETWPTSFHTNSPVLTRAAQACLLMCAKEREMGRTGFSAGGGGQRWLGGISDFISAAVHTRKHTLTSPHTTFTSSTPHWASDSLACLYALPTHPHAQHFSSRDLGAASSSRTQILTHLYDPVQICQCWTCDYTRKVLPCFCMIDTHMPYHANVFFITTPLVASAHSSFSTRTLATSGV